MRVLETLSLREVRIEQEMHPPVVTNEAVLGLVAD
jgi:hypothetical protein